MTLFEVLRYLGDLQTMGGVLLLVKLQASACNFTKSNIPPWVFCMFFKLHQ